MRSGENKRFSIDAAAWLTLSPRGNTGCNYAGISAGSKCSSVASKEFRMRRN